MYNFNTVCNALCLYTSKNSYRAVSKITGVSKSIIHIWNNTLKENILRSASKNNNLRKRKLKPTIIKFICKTIRKAPFLILQDV